MVEPVAHVGVAQQRLVAGGHPLRKLLGVADTGDRTRQHDRDPDGPRHPSGHVLPLHGGDPRQAEQVVPRLDRHVGGRRDGEGDDAEGLLLQSPRCPVEL